MIEPVKEKLPPLEMGILEAIALDAVLGYLLELDSPPKSD
jgi:hypothetical protein